MFTFTAGGKGRGVYTKLRLINEIKSYVTYLIANSNAEIYFFSNIEVGSELKNPHLHTQIWSDDFEAVEAIYERVIEKFGLNAKRCALSKPQRQADFYNYVIKDYSKDLNDDELWNLEQTKKRMRKTLGLKLRFYSRSKSKYTSKLYKMVYLAFGVLRKYADEFIEKLSVLFMKPKAPKVCTWLVFRPIFISIREQESVRVVYLEVFEVLFFAPSRDPPFRTLGSVYFDM